MKKTTFGYSLVVASALMMGACASEESPMTAGAGRITPLIELNSDVITTVSTGRSATSPTVDDLRLSLKSENGSYYKTWPSVAQFPTDEAFKIGKYTLEASMGSLNDEGFEKPYYYGSSTFSVNEGRTTEVSLTASLANTMVSIAYTEAFKSYFSAYSAELHSEGGTYITYASDETRPAYLRPGKVTLSLDITKPNGTHATIQPANIDEALARHHYRITLDVNKDQGGVGDAVLNVEFDDALEQETVTINLSDELMNAPAPTVTAEGFTVGQPMTVVEGETPSQAVRYMINSPGGLGSVTLTTQSESLIAKGWPAEIDLMRATEMQKSTMTSLGLKASGLWRQPERFAVVDLTGAIASLGAGDATFTLVVKDQMTKVNEPVSLGVTVTPVTLTVTAPESLEYGATEMDLTVVYDGDDFNDKVSFETSTDNGATWSTARIISVNDAARTPGYNVVIAVPAQGDVNVRALYCGKPKDGAEAVVAHEQLAYDIEVDAYANKALVKVSGTSAENIAYVVNYGVVKFDGVTKEADHRDAVNGLITLTGLTPATSYNMTVTLPDGQQTAPMQFTTEATLAVPNGDFEDLGGAQFAASKMNQGGQWSPTIGNPYYQSTLSFQVNEPTGWASVNAKTCNLSAANQMSWFVIPSTYNTTLTWQGTVPGLRIVNTGGGTETPDVYKNLKAQHGGNAMVVRNVAWDENGTTPAKHAKSRTSEYYYSENKPNPYMANRSAGKLFLGSYTYSNGKETYNEGISFASRPASLTGYYQYVNDPQNTSEKGMVTVTLLNGSTVIGQGSVKLGAASGYTQFTVPITYSKTFVKATALRIMITSSDKASYDMSAEASAIVTTDYISRYESSSRGAMLTVDNLSFVY
ncbi:MAG: DUF4493 domain-containing protein [Pseudoflavonifractor sp.]|nr:DUF4493 domain-containing protein [Pseudoflavonifractor sp.]